MVCEARRARDVSPRTPRRWPRASCFLRFGNATETGRVPPFIMATDRAPKLVIRPLRPDDQDLFLEGFDRLSEDSRYLRFFTPKPQLTPGEVRYLTHPDGVDHYALAAAAQRPDGSLRGVGVARFVRAHDDPRVAHVAITIVDDAQRLGLATQLIGALAYVARMREIERFRFVLLPENVAMRSFLVRHRVPMVVEDGLLVAEWDTERASHIRSSRRWRELLERSG